MINQKTIPSVFSEIDGEFSNHSIDAASFGRDAFSLPLTADTDHLYFGLWKPFSTIYAELKLANPNLTAFLVKYWDGAGWAILDNVIDDSKGFQRSGALQWDNPGEDWKKKTIEGKELYFIQLTPDANTFNLNAEDEVDETVSLSVQGINIVFSDDQDLKAAYPSVMNLLEQDEETFILRHETARDDIVQFLRNSGVMKQSRQLGVHAKIEAWDLLVIEEVRAWSKYLALANIFSGVQAKENGMWKQKATEYMDKAEDAKAAFYLTLDRNDDGVADQAEVMQQINTVTMVRR